MAVAGLEILKVKNQSGIICRCLIIKVQTKDVISNWDSVCNQSWTSLSSLLCFFRQVGQVLEMGLSAVTFFSFCTENNQNVEVEDSKVKVRAGERLRRRRRLTLY